jgi:hypothetical protein
MKTKTGLALVILGLGILGAWTWWTKTRNFEPVNAPVSLAAGQSVSTEFKLNFDGLYLIEIQLEKNIPLDTLDCRMGIEMDSTRCKDITPAIAANWILSSKGQEIRRGNSTDEHSATLESETLNRGIGEFQGKSGHEYKLQVAFTGAGSSLAPAHPRLKVSVASIAHTDLQSASVLVFSMAFICALFGAILLAIAYYTRGKARAA